MYRDEMEALRARINTLEAQLNAEQLRRDAAEAEAVASRAVLDEQQLAHRRSGELPRLTPIHAWPVAMVVAISTVSCLYLGMQWSRQWHRSRQLHRQLVFLHHHHQDACPIGKTPKVATIRSARSAAVPPAAKLITGTDVRRLQRQNIAALHNCYALGKTASIAAGQAALDVRTRVRRDGSLRAVSVTGGEPEMRRCVEQTVRGWHFHKTLSGPQTVAFPLPFRAATR